MAKRKPKATKAEPSPIPSGRVIYGGTLTRSFGALPGLLDKFVGVTCRFTLEAFTRHAKTIENAVGTRNAEPVKVDGGRVFRPGELLLIGAQGYLSAEEEDGAKTVLFSFNFLPVSTLYPLQKYPYLPGENESSTQ